MKEEIRLDGKLSKKLGLRDGNVGRANWDGERNNHIRHSAGLSKIVWYLFNRKYVTIFFITLPATLYTAYDVVSDLMHNAVAMC